MQFESEALTPESSAWTAEWRSASARLMPISQTLSAVADGRRLGTMVVQRLPDDTIALSNLSTDLQLPDDEQHVVRTALLQQAVLISEAVSPRYVRYLVSTRNVHVVKALKSAGFRSAGQVSEWMKLEESATAFHRPPDSCVFYEIDAAQIAAHELSHFTELLSGADDSPSGAEFTVPGSVLRDLLDETLEHSNDLPGLPLPSANQLFRLWGLSRSTVRIIVAVQNAQPTGLMATSMVDDGGEVERPELVIEYIGVRLESRRKGLAAGLLSLLSTGVRGKPLPRQLTAFAGAENEAACHLYSCLGFTPRDGLAVWIAS